MVNRKTEPTRRKRVVAAWEETDPKRGPEPEHDTADSDAELLVADGSDDDFDDAASEQTAEVNVESLISELEAERRRGNRSGVLSARRKLESYLEERRFYRAIEDFEDFDI